MHTLGRRMMLVFGMAMLMLAGVWEIAYGQSAQLRVPITPADSLLLSTRTGKYGPASVDQLVRWTERSTLVACPFYSATLNGRQLTKHLLGRQHEVAMELLGYSDNDPYDMTVVVAWIDIGPHGVVYRDWQYEPTITKAAYDSLYADWLCGANSTLPIVANPPAPK